LREGAAPQESKAGSRPATTTSRVAAARCGRPPAEGHV